jgi:hypothetical protein
VSDSLGVKRRRLVELGRVPGEEHQPAIDEHVRELKPASVRWALAVCKRGWRAIEWGRFCPARSARTFAGCG